MMKHILEFNNYQNLNEEELMEMANVDSKKTGIDNVVIWIGPNPSQHWKRIKVSNKANSFDGSDCFTLIIPEFKIIGNVNSKLINSDVLERIKLFVNKNLQTIIDYSEYKTSTSDLLDNLKKI